MNVIYSIYDISCNDEFSVQDIAENMFDPASFSIECPDFDVNEINIW